jgi:hypothetical protein
MGGPAEGSEETMGFSTGHAETSALVEKLLRTYEGGPRPDTS